MTDQKFSLGHINPAHGYGPLLLYKVEQKVDTNIIPMIVFNAIVPVSTRVMVTLSYVLENRKKVKDNDQCFTIIVNIYSFLQFPTNNPYTLQIDH